MFWGLGGLRLGWGWAGGTVFERLEAYPHVDLRRPVPWVASVDDKFKSLLHFLMPQQAWKTQLAGLCMCERCGDESVPPPDLGGQSHYLLEIEFGDESWTVDQNCSVK